MPSFVTDVEEIRKRAAQKIEDGAVTASYQGDVEHTISILNEALATEIVCVLRYMHHYFMATGVHGTAVRDEFKEHADAEREHADEIAERIQQLGGKPDFNPASLLQRSASQYAEGKTLADMIKEDLIAERIVIEVYSKMIRHFADHDPTTRVSMPAICRTCCLLSIPGPVRPRAKIRGPIRSTCITTSSRASNAAGSSQSQILRTLGMWPNAKRVRITANSTSRRHLGRAAARSSRSSLIWPASAIAKALEIWSAPTRHCWIVPSAAESDRVPERRMARIRRNAPHNGSEVLAR